jgi:hypothetical protein
MVDPGTSEMTKFAAFWRDNRCYICNAVLGQPTGNEVGNEPDDEYKHLIHEQIRLLEERNKVLDERIAKAEEYEREDRLKEIIKQALEESRD